MPTPPASRGLSSSLGCPAASTFRWPSEYRRVSTVAVDSRAAATVCRWLCVWTPGEFHIFPSTPGRPLASIVRHSFHGQGFAGKRAGEQPLQSFHFVPATRLSCLDDTRLQSSDPTFTLSPVNLFPSDRLAGGCTRSFSRVHLRFPPVKVLRVLSSRTTRWKSARLHGGTMLQSLSVPLQNGVRFFQFPLPATPSAFLADAPAPQPGRNVGFTMLGFSDMNESGSLPSTPAVWNVRVFSQRARESPTTTSAFSSICERGVSPGDTSAKARSRRNGCEMVSRGGENMF